MAEHTGLASDRALLLDSECMEVVRGYAADQGRFFDDFAVAYNKVSARG